MLDVTLFAEIFSSCDMNVLPA